MILLDIFGSLYQPNSAHDMITIFNAEDFSDFFRDGYASTRNDLCEERNVFFVNLNRQELTSQRNAKNPVI